MTHEPAESETTPRIWMSNGFVDDDWHLAATLDELTGNGRHILPLSLFLQLTPDQAERHAGRLGVLVEPGEELEPLLHRLPELALVALRFPAFNDGRSYSKAVLLRTRHGYEGDLRAVGDVLVDQVAHMLRCGFSSLELTNPVAIARLSAGDTGENALHYQPAVAATAPAPGYAWRRRNT